MLCSALENSNLATGCRKIIVSKKILIVDDDRVLADMLGIFLETFGYPKPVYAGDGAEGLYAMECDAEITLIFTDREMPNMEGPEFIEKCRRTYQEKKIIYMSATLNAEDDLIAVAKEVGADAALPKPFFPHGVMDALAIVGVNPEMFQ